MNRYLHHIILSHCIYDTYHLIDVWYCMSNGCISRYYSHHVYLMALLWKMICNLGDPMSLRHPVSMFGIA